MPASTPSKPRKTAAQYDAEVLALSLRDANLSAPRRRTPSAVSVSAAATEAAAWEAQVARAQAASNDGGGSRRSNNSGSSKKKKSAAAASSSPASKQRATSRSPKRSASQKRARSNSRKRATPASPASSRKKKAAAAASSSAKKKSSASRRRGAAAASEDDDNDDDAASEDRSSSSPAPPVSSSRTSRNANKVSKLVIPADARTVDAMQLARLQNPNPSPSPMPGQPDYEEDYTGPKGYLTQKGLQTLKEYKYVSGFTGATDKYIMIPLWNWSLQFVPIWMAPNLLTTMSLACGVACYFLFQYFSPDFVGNPPAWMFYLTSFLMFFYLILDGLDGKQARRTGSSSPLGQLFDHGCDSICCFLCGIFMSSCIQLGAHRSAFVVLVLHILPFYTSNWEEYCTGVMRFGVIGITEGQLMICFLLALTGYIGVDAWNTPIPIPPWFPGYVPAFMRKSFEEPMECKFILIFLGTLGVCYQILSSCMSVWQYQTEHRDEIKASKTYNKAKRMFSHYLLFLALGIVWVFSPSTFYREHPRIVLLTIGMLFGYQVSRLIISRVTKDPYPFFFLNSLFVPYVALIVNCYTGEQLFATYPAAVAYLAFVTLCYAHFIVTTITQICDFLEIQCFRIKVKKVQ